VPQGNNRFTLIKLASVEMNQNCRGKKNNNVFTLININLASADFTCTKLLKRLAIQVDGYHVLTAREMALIVNVELVKGNAQHAA